MQHLDHDVICALAAGRLSPSGSPEVYAHLDGCGDCLAAVAAVAAGTSSTIEKAGSDVVGHVIADRFAVRHQLGEGGMGEVYLAHDAVLGEDVAIKLLHPGIAGSQRAVERLRRELVLGRRISHPNVCRVHDVGVFGDRPFISMEFVRGRSLAEAIRGRLLNPGIVLRGAAALCAAVDAIHGAGVVHRDLKPGNVLVDEAGRFVVADFGLAADVRFGDASRGALGTPLYWAPEQARGEAATPRTDVYALGLILDELFEAFLTEEQRSRCAPVVQRCLQADPAARFPSAAAVGRALVDATEPRARSARLVPVAIAVGLATLMWASLGTVVATHFMPEASVVRAAGLDVRPGVAAAESLVPPVTARESERAPNRDEAILAMARPEVFVSSRPVASVEPSQPASKPRRARRRARKIPRRKPPAVRSELWFFEP